MSIDYSISLLQALFLAIKNESEIIFFVGINLTERGRNKFSLGRVRSTKFIIIISNQAG